MTAQTRDTVIQSLLYNTAVSTYIVVGFSEVEEPTVDQE